MKSVLWVSIVLLILSGLSGCASREGYHEAIVKQNDTIQLHNAQQERQKEYDKELKEKRRNEHNLLMTALMIKMVDGAAKTSTPVDDILGPILFMVMEDKFATTELVLAAFADKDKTQPATLQKIEAPEEVGDILQKSTALFLGIAGIGANVWVSDIHSKTLQTAFEAAGSTYGLSGENNEMNVDSFKSGSSNTVSATGDSGISGGDTADGVAPEEVEELEEEEVEEEEE